MVAVVIVVTARCSGHRLLARLCDLAGWVRRPVDVRRGAGVGRSAAGVAAKLPSRASASAERVPGSAV